MNGAFGQVDDLCLAEFAAYYYKDYKPIEDRQNDNQPVILTDQILENQHLFSQILPTKISLMTKKETMKGRKVKAVIRFHKPSKTTAPEKYFHHVLMLYFPWREESDLIGPEGTYASKLHDPLVRQLSIEINHHLNPMAKLLKKHWNTCKIIHNIPCMEKDFMHLQNKKIVRSVRNC